MSEKKQNNLHLTVGPEDSVSFGQATMLGIQHVLAMDVYVVPVIIASIIGISTAQTSSLIQATFIARTCHDYSISFLYEITSCARPFIYSNRGNCRNLFCQQPTRKWLGRSFRC